MKSPEIAELAGIRTALVSIIKDLRMLEGRIASLEYSVGSHDTIEVDDDDFTVGPSIEARDSYDTISTKKGLENWRVLKEVVVDDDLSEEVKGENNA